MSTIKPFVSEKLIYHLLAQHFGGPVTDFQPLEGGLVAQTFAFSASGQGYVIRFITERMDVYYDKEEFIWQHYGSAEVPIPDVIRVGLLEGLPYCITRKAVGRRLDQLSVEEVRPVVASVIQTLNAIHTTNVSEQQGYGIFDAQGHGSFGSWAESLTNTREEERPDGFFGRWHDLFETTFLERSVFDQIYHQMEEVLGYCPNDRYLVHGGYGFGNLLVAEDRVTAVIDWLDAKYGDFLYDVAWLHFWDLGHNYLQLYRANYGERGLTIPNFEQRQLCYQCYIALDGLRFFAKSDKVGHYQWTRDRILHRIAQSTG